MRKFMACQVVVTYIWLADEFLFFLKDENSFTIVNVLKFGTTFASAK